jgi:hypothetical protein
VSDGTVASAADYADSYYNTAFQFGMGTEHIIDALTQIPAVDCWLDLGSGSESLFWSIPLSARTLLAVDRDQQRLDLLEQIAKQAQPRGAYQTVLDMCGRTADDYAARRSSLMIARADCLTAAPLLLPHVPADGFDLITQLGLLGLTTSTSRFRTCWGRAHALLKAGGWCAGANWVAAPDRHGAGRVHLTRDLYLDAMNASGIAPQILTRIPIHGDPTFTALWLYLGRKT